jgi:hypothetical protein
MCCRSVALVSDGIGGGNITTIYEVSASYGGMPTAHWRFWFRTGGCDFGVRERAESYLEDCGTYLGGSLGHLRKGWYNCRM